VEVGEDAEAGHEEEGEGRPDTERQRKYPVLPLS